jgi:hypothetical protein
MPRLLHTADWQLGLKLRAVAGERGARARDERFRVIGRLAAVAKAEAVDVVVVAGDVFDDNQVGPWLVARAEEELAAFAPIPVLLLPGNHDAAEPGGALERLARRGGLPHVTVALDEAPVALGGLQLFPCPLRERHTLLDPTAHVPARAPGDEAVRVVVAHGGVLDFGSPTELPNRIRLPELLAKGVDYVALGDWHGVYEADARAWYSGAPEPTRFAEKRPGFALLVDLPGAGVAPSVREVPVAATSWHEREVGLWGPEDVDALIAWLGGLPSPSATLVKLRLSGAVGLADRARLDAALAEASERLLHLQLRSDDVVTTVSDADLADLDAPGFLGDALDALRASDDPLDLDAARLLVALLREEAP